MLKDFFIVDLPIEKGHICSKEPEEGDALAPISPYALNNQQLTCYPTKAKRKIVYSA